MAENQIFKKAKKSKIQETPKKMSQRFSYKFLCPQYEVTSMVFQS